MALSVASCVVDTTVAGNSDGQQEAVSPTKFANATGIVEGSPLSSSSESADIEGFNTDSEVASSCSGSPVQVGDSVVVREGPRIGQTGTVVDDDGGSGYAIQVSLSNGAVDWFARSPSHDVSSGDVTDSDKEIERIVKEVESASDAESFNASELESASESDFEQACVDAWLCHQGPDAVSAVSKAIDGQSPISDQKQLDQIPQSLTQSLTRINGPSQHGSDSHEPPIKRTRVEDPVEKMENDGDESRHRESCLSAVGA